MKHLPHLLAALFLAAAPADAQVAPRAVLQGAEAAEAVTREAGAASDGTELPRLAGAGGGERLRALWNVDAVLAGRPQTPQGLRGLARWSQEGTNVLRLYLERQQRRADKGDGPDYQDEIALGLRFVIHVTRNLQEGALEGAAAQPATSAEEKAAREAALARVGTGLGQITEGALVVVAEPVLRPENQRAIAAALAQDVPGFAPTMPPEQRQALARRAEEAARRVRDDAARKHLEAVRQALAAG